MRYLFAALALCLSGCGFSLNQVRLDVDQNARTQIGVRIAENPKETRSDETGQRKPNAQQTIDALERCFGESLMERREAETIYLSFSKSDMTFDDIDELWRCGQSDAPFRFVESRVDAGILYDTRIILLDMRGQMGGAPSARTDLIPAELRITMPAEFEVRDVSSRSMFALNISRPDPQTAILRPSIIAANVAAADALLTEQCPDIVRCSIGTWEYPRSIQLLVELRSHHYHYGFNEALGLFGLLFGSGIAVGAVRGKSARKSSSR